MAPAAKPSVWRRISARGTDPRVSRRAGRCENAAPYALAHAGPMLSLSDATTRTNCVAILPIVHFLFFLSSILYSMLVKNKIITVCLTVLRASHGKAHEPAVVGRTPPRHELGLGRGVSRSHIASVTFDTAVPAASLAGAARLAPR